MVAKKKWMDGRLPILIGYTPINLEKTMVIPESDKRTFYYNFVTDGEIIIDEKTSKVFYFLGLALIVLCLLGFIMTGGELISGLLIGVFISSILIIIGYTLPPKKTILDRHENTFTFPNWFYSKPITIPFHKTKAVWSSRGGVSGAIGMQLVVQHPNSPKGTDISMHAGGFENAWSFMVWYMDKNRPLPPGDAFDPYREKDFKRRKAEGFPPPLYKSRVPTPEATPEQQAERNKYWRDEDYYGTIDTAWY